jgi:signal transduction histidine kinase
VTRRLVASYLALAVVVLVALEIPLGLTYARGERQELTRRVERDAVVLATLSEDTLERGAARLSGRLATLVDDYAGDTGARVVITDARGVAVADTDPPVPGRRSFASRPEVRGALGGDIVSGVRRSETLGTDLLYVAVPVASSGVIHGAVRLTYPTSAVDRRVDRYWLTLAAVAGVVLTLTALIGWVLARQVSRPLARLEAGAAAAGAGDLGVRVDPAGPPEVRALGEEFNAMVATLERLVRAQEAFVSDASHQLRTPLTALRLRLENLEAGVGDAGAADVEAVQAEVDRLGRLVDGLLALARADRRPVPAQPVDVGAVVAERAGAWAALAEELGVAIRTDVPGRLGALAAPGTLEQVLDNLIENALGASPAGGAVTLSAAAVPGAVEVRVADQGPGIPPADRERAFDRFWRAPDAVGDGTGLGLAIVRRLVRADGGDVVLDEAPGGGLEAVVTLRAS